MDSKQFFTDKIVETLTNAVNCVWNALNWDQFSGPHFWVPLLRNIYHSNELSNEILHWKKMASSTRVILIAV